MGESMESRDQELVLIPKAAGPDNFRLLLSAKSTDLVLICGPARFMVHSWVICSKSAILAAECAGPFQEAQRREIVVGAPAASVCALDRMIKYLYVDDYSDRATLFVPDANGLMVAKISKVSKKESKGGLHGLFASVGKSSSNEDPAEPGPGIPFYYCDSKSLLVRNLEVYSLADYYGIDDLAHLASTRFCAGLVDSDPSEFAAVVPLVFNCTPPDNPVQKFVVGHAVSMRPVLIKNALFLTKALDNSRFAAAYFRQLVDEHQLSLFALEEFKHFQRRRNFRNQWRSNNNNGRIYGREDPRAAVKAVREKGDLEPACPVCHPHTLFPQEVQSKKVSEMGWLQRWLHRHFTITNCPKCGRELDQ